MTKRQPAIDISNYEALRPHLGLRLANRHSPKALTDSCPGGSYLDLLTLPYLLMEGESGSEDDIHVMPVRRDMLDGWGIKREELLADATRNMPRMLPPSFQTLEHTLQGVTKNEDPLLFSEPGDGLASGLYVLTNSRAVYGAACILYPGLMEEIYQLLGAYYVLPCSVHEMIITPDHEALTPSGLADIVRNVNREVLDESDYLSDSVYYYGEKGMSMLCSEAVTEPAVMTV